MAAVLRCTPAKELEMAAAAATKGALACWHSPLGWRQPWPCALSQLHPFPVVLLVQRLGRDPVAAAHAESRSKRSASKFTPPNPVGPMPHCQ